MADKKRTTDKKDIMEVRAYSFFIVYNNPRIHGVAGIAPEEMVEMSNQQICDLIVEGFCNRKSKQAVAIYCVSDMGLEHLHIVFSSENQMRLGSIKKFLGNPAHIKATRGSKEQVEAYINKTGKHAESGEVILAKAQIGEIKGSMRGHRTDIEVIRDAIDNGMTWKEVRRMDDKFFENRYTTMIKNMYFDKRAIETPFKRSVAVHWYIGESGSGKTGITLDLVERLGEERLYLVSDYKNGFDAYSGEPVLVLDEFRGQLQYAMLLGMLEGYKKEIPARYSNVLGLWNEVHITTIKTPEQVYAKMIDAAEADEDPVSQLLSRITDVSYCYKVNRATGSKIDRNGNPADFYRCMIPGDMYRALDKSKGDKVEQIKKIAKLEYQMKYYQPGDSVEVFGIKEA